VLFAQQSTKQSNKQASLQYQFELTPQGVCTFNGAEYYQLQTNSRFSFLGCWLTLMPATAQNTLLKGKKKQLFIYRDSLSEQDFSRLSRAKKFSAGG